jgi:tetratricopeptide (TPR) repeat protein
MSAMPPRVTWWALACAGALQAQTPPRPRLSATTDTNSATAYYLHGMSLLTSQPSQAMAAFVWASRLQPDWAEPLYALRVATHLNNPSRLEDYLLGRGYARSREVRAIDSLTEAALLRNPVLYRGLEWKLFERYFLREYGTIVAPKDFAGTDPLLNARIAYLRSDFATAVAHYARALKRTPKAVGLYMDRGFAYFHLRQPDSAVAQMQAFIAAQAKQEQEEVVFYYRSKAFAEYAIGWIHDLRGKVEEARAAYARALAEDLSFYMAHLRLAIAAEAQRDTATALQEYALAAELRPDDPVVRARYGAALLQAGRAEEALAHADAARQTASDYAAPYLVAGKAADQLGQGDRAAVYYEAFLARAARKDAADLEHARRRLGELRGRDG